MARHVRVYLEGGGDQASGLSACRRAFGDFFRLLQEEAAANGAKLDFVAAGGRGKAFDKFKTAVETAPERVNLLLVDSEEPPLVGAKEEKHSTWRHFRDRPGDGWERPAGIDDNRALLIIQALEAWLLLDDKALRKKYGECLVSKGIPLAKVSDKSPSELVDILERATAKCSAKYSKMHAFEILPHVRLDLVESDPSGERAIRLIRQHLGLKLSKK